MIKTIRTNAFWDKYLKILYLLFFMLLLFSLATLSSKALTVNLSSSHPIKLSAEFVKISPNGNFAVGYNDNYVYAFNKSGVLWKRELKATCVDVGKRVAVGENGRVLVLALNGSVIWAKKVEGKVESIATYSNFVVAGTDRGYVYYFNGSGGIVWRYNCNRLITNVGITKNFVAVTDVDGNLYYFEKCENLPWKFTAGDKTLMWIYKTGWCIWKYEEIAKSYVYPTLVMSVTNENVILVCENAGKVFCFSKKGYLEWIRNTSLPLSASSNGKYTVVGCQNGNVYVFSERGNLLWKMKFNYPAFVSVSSDGRYVAVGDGNSVYIFNSSGELLWVTYADSVKCVSISNSGNVAVAGSKVYFITPEFTNFSKINIEKTESSVNSTKVVNSNLDVKQTPTPKLKTPKVTAQPKITPSKSMFSSLPLKYLAVIPLVVVAGIVLRRKFLVSKKTKKKNLKNKKKVKGKKKLKSKSKKGGDKTLKRLKKAKKVA